MATPAELRKLTEQGKQKKQEREAEERKVAAQKAHEAAREKAYKEVLESDRIITNISGQLDRAASDGFATARVYTIPYEDVTRKPAARPRSVGLHVGPPEYELRGIAKRIYEHFKKEGFEVVVEEQAGAFDPEGPTSETYHIRLGW
jgi:hypothetical protein